MTKTNRFISLLSLAAAGLVFGSVLAVEPGESVDLKATASVSPCLTEVLIDPNAPSGAEADASCDEMAGTLQATSVISGLVETAFSAAASAAVLYEFEVEAGPGSEGNMVDGMLAYRMSWLGVTKEAGSGAYLVSINLEVEDISDPGLPESVASVVIHEQVSGTGVDEGSSQDILSLMLERGHSYRVTASLATLAVTEASTDPSTGVADFLSDVGSALEAAGVSVDILALQVGFDVEELAAQVEANTMAIEENAKAIEANTEAIGDLAKVVGLLADEVAAIKQALEDLGEALANHTHTYLTGKGVGHNNTEATTGPADVDEGEEPTPMPQSRVRNNRSKFKR
jgi:hypothetical protein